MDDSLRHVSERSEIPASTPESTVKKTAPQNKISQTVNSVLTEQLTSSGTQTEEKIRATKQSKSNAQDSDIGNISKTAIGSKKEAFQGLRTNLLSIFNRSRSKTSSDESVRSRSQSAPSTMESKNKGVSKESLKELSTQLSQLHIRDSKTKVDTDYRISKGQLFPLKEGSKLSSSENKEFEATLNKVKDHLNQAIAVNDDVYKRESLQALDKLLESAWGKRAYPKNHQKIVNLYLESFKKSGMDSALISQLETAIKKMNPYHPEDRKVTLGLLKFAIQNPENCESFLKLSQQIKEGKINYKNPASLTQLRQLTKMGKPGSVPPNLQDSFNQTRIEMLKGFERNKKEVISSILRSTQEVSISEPAQFRGAAKEILETERRFLDQMKNLIYKETKVTDLTSGNEQSVTFFTGLKQQGLISEDEHQLLTSSFQKLNESSNSLIQLFTNASNISDQERLQDLTTTFTSNSFEKHLDVVGELVKNHAKFNEIMNRVKNTPKGKAMVETFDQRGDGTQQDIVGLLLEPVQRLARYGLLLNTVAKNAEGESPNPMQDGLLAVAGFVELKTQEINRQIPQKDK